jgi:hypothetical protein
MEQARRDNLIPIVRNPIMDGTSHFLNTGKAGAPCLQVYLNLDTLIDHAEFNLQDERGLRSCFERIRGDGFEGVQYTKNVPFQARFDFPHCGLDRINNRSDADTVAARHADRGELCVTLHAGWGIEDDAEVFRLVEGILSASLKYHLPMFIETHRSTITQDIWRTVQITKQFPEVRFNGDFSHYYCGLEMVYGDWAQKMAFMEPIFSRTAFMHGRIASPGCMQVPIEPDLTARPRQAHGTADYLLHFKDIWIRAMSGFLRAAQPGDTLIFAPEILAPRTYYARMFPNQYGELVEESDRYAQALLYRDLARACFADAKLSVSQNSGTA